MGRELRSEILQMALNANIIHQTLYLFQSPESIYQSLALWQANTK